MRPEETFTEQATEPDKFLPSVSIDCVIFGFHDQQIKVLLINFKNTDIWALPGGYIRLDEDMDEAATRILRERASVEDIYLEQFYTFGHRERVCRDLQQRIFNALNIPLSPDAWISQRFVSVGYYALVDFSKVIPKPDEHLQVCTWFGLDELPALAFDHSDIVQKALTTLQSGWIIILSGLIYCPTPLRWRNYKACMRLFWVKNCCGLTFNVRCWAWKSWNGWKNDSLAGRIKHRICTDSIWLKRIGITEDARILIKYLIIRQLIEYSNTQKQLHFQREIFFT